jgi:hypothetical protein
VLQLLRNQVYIGNMVQCKRKVSSFKTKKRLVTCPDDWVIVENTHEAMIDDYTWDCVQRRLELTRKAPSNSPIRSGTEENIFSGIIRCAECGAAMAFNHKKQKDGSVRNFYRCSQYANSGSGSCTMHKVDVDLLETVILKDIQHHAEIAVKDEERLLTRLLSFTGHERQNKKAAQEKTLRDAVSRIRFVEDASKKLFEEKMAGNVPDSLFKKLMADYEREIVKLDETAADLRRSVTNSESGAADINQWLALIKECSTVDRLDRATAFQLIDHVAVHEQCDECGIKTHDIEVNYRFVGCLS